MKKIYKIILLILALLIYRTSFSKEVTVAEAERAAKNWKNHVSLNKRIAQVRDTRKITFNGIITRYVFTFTGGGFVILSADDNVRPVLGYSDDGEFPENITNETVKGWLENYDSQIHSVIVTSRQLPITSIKTANKAWVDLMNNTFSMEKSGKGQVGPLLTTKWDQGCYYNTQCPSDNRGPCKHVYAGCVAVAMAQVMKYHNFPYKGIGSHSYYWGMTKLTADFGNTHYAWENMPDELIAENSEVARLMYHCGVSVDMGYSYDGSGAYREDIKYALRAYFNYSNSEIYYKSNYSDNDWSIYLKNQINWRQPVIYCGSPSSGSGHAFVCDGYDASGNFHFNWGWSGQCDGYYSLTNLNPGGYNFTYKQTAIMGIYPVKPIPVADFTSDDIYINAGDSIHFRDKSYYATNWEWTFPGGTPSASTEQNPTVTYTAQGTYSVTLKASNSYGSNTKTVTNYLVYPATTPICEYLNYPFPGTQSVYTSTSGGYITGTNGYKDRAKANYFENYYSNKNLTAAIFKFAAAKSISGTNPEITFCVWDNTGTGGKPGNILISQTMRLSEIAEDVKNQKITYVVFPAPVKITAPYYVGVILPTTAGDELALYSDKNGETLTNMAMEQWNDGSWHDFSAWGSGAYKIFALYIAQRFCSDNLPLKMQTDYKDSTICGGRSITIKSNITGGKPPFTYKWNTGGNNSSITVTPTQITTYKLSVTDSNNKTSVDSTTIYAYPSPEISHQPVSQTSCEGESAVFSFGMTGATGCLYQWQVSTNSGQTYTNIIYSDPILMMLSDYKTARATSDMNNNRYRCIISSPCGIILTTSAVTLTVSYPPVINMHPVSISVCPGSRANFSVSATGSQLSYQWQQSTDGGESYTDIGGAVINKYSITSVSAGQNNYKYRCKVSGNCLPILTTSGATLTIDNSCGTCSTLNYPLKGTQIMYRTTYGWASGTNEFKFSAFAQYFRNIPSNYMLSGLKIKFGRARGTGTHNVTIKAWDNTGKGNSPGNVIAQKTITMLQIRTDITNNVYSSITFDTPVFVSQPFFAGVMVPTLTGDTIAIVTNHDGEGTAGAGWLCYQNEWYSFDYNPLKEYQIDLAISAVICKNCPSLNVSVETSRTPVLCENQGIILSANISDNVFYQWRKNNINISNATNSQFIIFSTQLSNSGTYTVRVKNADSCAAESPPVELMINPLPQPSLGQDRTIYTNQTIILTPGVIYRNYIWSNGSSDPYLEVKGTTLSPGTYTYSVIVTDENGCKGNAGIRLFASSSYYTLSGKVAYDNSSGSPVRNCKLILINTEGKAIDSTITDTNGSYDIMHLQSGNYSLMLKPAKKWGGVDPTDALLLNRYFTGTYTISNKLRYKAGDVNIDGKINPTDALLVNRRFVQVVTTFKQKDWVYEPIEVFLREENTICTIICICTGDINGSYNPTY